MSLNEQMYEFGSARSAIREIAGYAAQRREEIGADKVFDFSIGNPSTPAPREVHDSIARSLELPEVQVHSYTPANGFPWVRQKLADYLCRRFGDNAATADNLYLTCGAAAGVSIALHALVNEGDEVLVITPYFPEYKVWIEHAGGVCVEVPADKESFLLDCEAIDQAITPKTKALIVDSPNNPVGVIYPPENLCELSKTLTKAQERIGHELYLLSDEPYREITYGKEVPWVPDFYDRSIVCYSYSKSLSLPGERLGWILVPPANPEAKKLMPTVAGSGRALGFVCAPALFQRVLADCLDVKPNVEAYRKNRELLMAGLTNAGYHVIEPQGAFYLWVQALEPDAQAFFEKAKSLNLLPVPSDCFGCKGWFRVSFCVSEECVKNSLPAWKKLAEMYLHR